MIPGKAHGNGGKQLNRQQIRAIVIAIVISMLFFSVVMVLGMGLVVLNERSAPDFPWFPIPIIGLLVAAIVGMQRWRPIGLAIPTDVPWGRVYGFAVAITVVGIVVCILQGAYHGYVRVSEGVQTDVSPAFALLYWFVMSLFAAVLAEAAFRGVMQTRLMAVLGVWPAIVIVGIVNTAAHRWNIELFQQWLGIFVTLAGWGYLRYLGRSLVPPMVAHGVTNFLLAFGLWVWGPFDQGALGTGSLVLIAATGVVALVIAITLARSVTAQRKSSYQPAYAQSPGLE